MRPLRPAVLALLLSGWALLLAGCLEGDPATSPRARVGAGKSDGGCTDMLCTEDEVLVRDYPNTRGPVHAQRVSRGTLLCVVQPYVNDTVDPQDPAGLRVLGSGAAFYRIFWDGKFRYVEAQFVLRAEDPPATAPAAPRSGDFYACGSAKPAPATQLLAEGERYEADDYLIPVAKTSALPLDYAPPAADLAWIPQQLLAVPAQEGSHDLRLRRKALTALAAWADHVAASCGAYCELPIRLKVGADNTAYRSLATQCAMLSRYGAAIAAFPGTSEHHLATAVDLGSVEQRDSACQPVYLRDGAGALLRDGQGTPIPAQISLGSLACVRNSARRFGFVKSYPPGTTAYTGYADEAWHFRYVGTAAAALHWSLVEARGNISTHELFDEHVTPEQRETLEQAIDDCPQAPAGDCY